MIATKSILSDTITAASAIGDAESPEGRMQRFAHILDLILPHIPGNLVEIGGGAGLTTRVLLAAAKKHNRQVLVIDPFETNKTAPESYVKPYPYEKFREGVKGMESKLIICPHASLSFEAHNQLTRLGQIAFAFLDGEQSHGTVLNELYMMQNMGVNLICVDDINRNTAISQVPSAVRDFLCSDECAYTATDVQKPLIEGYLIRK